MKDETDRIVTSLAQDMITVARKVQIKAIKSLKLGIAVRNLTANNEVLVLLNKFGHTISRRAYNTFVWDNNDLCEET